MNLTNEYAVVLVTLLIVFAVNSQSDSEYDTDSDFDDSSDVPETESADNATVLPVERACQALRKIQQFLDNAMSV